MAQCIARDSGRTPRLYHARLGDAPSSTDDAHAKSLTSQHISPSLEACTARPPIPRLAAPHACLTHLPQGFFRPPLPPHHHKPRTQQKPTPHFSQHQVRPHHSARSHLPSSLRLPRPRPTSPRAGPRACVSCLVGGSESAGVMSRFHLPVIARPRDGPMRDACGSGGAASFPVRLTGGSCLAGAGGNWVRVVLCGGTGRRGERARAEGFD